MRSKYPAVWIARRLVEAMVEEAHRYFPRETGGVLIGYTGAEGDIVVMDVVGPGPRALHGKSFFAPDYQYHDFEIVRNYEESGRIHTYLGDWHTHPEGSTRLSRLDLGTLQRLARAPEARAPAPLMAILGGGSPWRLSVWRFRPQAGRHPKVQVLPLHLYDPE